MEINNKNKVSFFALYWGGNLVCTHRETSITFGAYGTVNELTLSEQYQDNFKKSCLQLKPLSQISDEDLLKCYHLHSSSIGYDYTMDFAPVDEMVNHWMEHGGNKDIQKNSLTVDYLRSKGHALPWMGLSVEEMVNVGWIKLIEI